jgi:hypothetical protein
VRQTRFRVGALIAVAAAVGLIIWAALPGGGSSTPKRATAVPVSADGLRTLAGVLNRPIYWAGQLANVNYELTQTPDQRVYVRYLPDGVDVGAEKPYLTVGTYPVKNAFTITQTAAGRKDAVKINVGGGGVAFYSTRVPQSVYLAYPGSDYQIEVYDPSAKLAHQVAGSGKVAPVKPGSGGAKPGASAVAVSAKGLKTLAGVLGRPLYWAGSEDNVTYELTRTPDGRVYIRYLPEGVEVGANRRVLTIGTYPVKDAYATTKSASRQKGTVKIDVGGGGVAFYSTSVPQSVYLAYPGSDYQVEVYDPSAQRAHSLVSSGRIGAIS